VKQIDKFSSFGFPLRPLRTLRETIPNPPDRPDKPEMSVGKQTPIDRDSMLFRHVDL